MRFALLMACLLAALLLAAPASASDRWAGLTRGEAVALAKRDVVAFFVTVDRIPTAKASKIRRYLDQTRPRKVERVRCFDRRQAWRVVWPKMDALYVAKRGLLFAC